MASRSGGSRGVKPAPSGKSSVNIRANGPRGSWLSMLSGSAASARIAARMASSFAGWSVSSPLPRARALFTSFSARDISRGSAGRPRVFSSFAVIMICSIMSAQRDQRFPAFLGRNPGLEAGEQGDDPPEFFSIYRLPFVPDRHYRGRHHSAPLSPRGLIRNMCPRGGGRRGCGD